MTVRSLAAKIVITQIEDMRGKRETNSLTLLVTYLFLFIDVIQLYRTGSFPGKIQVGELRHQSLANNIYAEKIPIL